MRQFFARIEQSWVYVNRSTQLNAPFEIVAVYLLCRQNCIVKCVQFH